jgi:hypothetical protein
MKQLLLLSIVSLVIIVSIFLYQYVYYSDKRLHIVFCAVGNGKAILMRMPSGEQLLIDGGPDNSVLSCLDSYTPFWWRVFDLVILDSQDRNSYSGLIYVLNRYIIKCFALYNNISISQEMQGIKEGLGREHSLVQSLQIGARFRFREGVVVSFAEDGLEIYFRSFTALVRCDCQNIPFSSSKVALLQTMRVKDFQDVPLEKLSPDILVVSGEQNSVYSYARKRVLLSSGKHVEIVSDGKQWWVK